MKKLLSITALGLLAAALVSTVALAGRADESKTDSRPAATSSAAAASPSQSTPHGQGSVVSKPGTQTIAQIAAGNPAAFSTLVSLLQLTGLDAVVGSNDVTLTVFAPTNAAFTKLFTAYPSLPGILTSPDQAAAGYPLLKNVLLYHVTDGRRFSNSIFNENNPKTIGMLNGGSITANPNLTLADAAGQTINPVLTPDALINISASNGVIHVIDTVLLPSS
jgi:uncharacterized surface protein with fasciclin (FAS1) repeats